MRWKILVFFFWYKYFYYFFRRTVRSASVSSASTSEDSLDNIPSAPPSPNPPLLPHELTQVDFLGRMGLCTHDVFKELQNKRVERKRRSTANPHFLYGNTKCKWDQSAVSNFFFKFNLMYLFKCFFYWVYFEIKRKITSKIFISYCFLI